MFFDRRIIDCYDLRMEKIKLSQLEAFYWVAKLGSFQNAASHLRTTQPGISARIKLLEAVLGVTLLDRTARNARLTAKGRALADYAERMLALARELRHDIGDRQALGGRVRLGVADTVALTWLPRFLSRVHALYPKLEIELEIELTIHLMRRLGAREIDLAFLAAPVSEVDYVQVPLCSYPLHWTAGSGFPLPAGALSPAQLAGFTVITHTRGSHQHETVLKWFHAAGAEPRRVSTSSSLASVIRLTAAGLGVSLQTPAVIARETAAGELVPVPTTVPVPDLHFYSAHHRSGAQDAARALSDLALAEAKLEHPEKRMEMDQFL